MLACTEISAFDFQDAPKEPRWAKIDPSSWIGWSCFALGFLTVGPEALRADLAAGGFGSAVVALGVAAFFAATVALQRHLRLSLRSVSYAAPRRLVTSGPFRYSRNPIYVAFLLPIAAIGVFSALAALAAAVAYVSLTTAIVIRAEERVLAHNFPDEYAR